MTTLPGTEVENAKPYLTTTIPNSLILALLVRGFLILTPQLSVMLFLQYRRQPCQYGAYRTDFPSSKEKQ